MSTDETTSFFSFLCIRSVYLNGDGNVVVVIDNIEHNNDGTGNTIAILTTISPERVYFLRYSTTSVDGSHGSFANTVAHMWEMSHWPSGPSIEDRLYLINNLRAWYVARSVFNIYAFNIRLHG